MAAEINNEEVARRIRALREDLGISMQEMADATGRTLANYRDQETGRAQITFTFLSKCADALGVTEIELLTGESPHLKGYSLVREGDGLNINRNSYYEYLHKAPNLAQNHLDPFLVTAPYREEEQDQPLHLSYHEGLELDYILEGRIRFQYVDDNGALSEEIAGPGDTLLYNSANGHGISAIDGKPCRFLAVVVKPNSTEIR